MEMIIIGLILIVIILFIFSAIRVSDESKNKKINKRKSRH